MPITVKRLSDGSVHVIPDAGPTTFVKSIKSNLRKHHAPHFPNGNNTNDVFCSNSYLSFEISDHIFSRISVHSNIVIASLKFIKAVDLFLVAKC